MKKDAKRPRAGRKKNLLTTIGVLAIGASAGLAHLPEAQAYQVAISSNDPATLEQFLRVHPTSQYAPDVIGRLSFGMPKADTALEPHIVLAKNDGNGKGNGNGNGHSKGGNGNGAKSNGGGGGNGNGGQGNGNGGGGQGNSGGDDGGDGASGDSGQGSNADADSNDSHGRGHSNGGNGRFHGEGDTGRPDMFGDPGKPDIGPPGQFDPPGQSGY